MTQDQAQTTPEAPEFPAVAPRPETRYVVVKLTGAYKGWRCRAKADFPTQQLVDLASGDIEKIITVLGEIVVEHNFPNGAGELAATIQEVDPYRGLLMAGEAIFTELGKLPNP